MTAHSRARLVEGSAWLTRAATALLPLSVGPVIGEALREWRYTGAVFDYRPESARCGLCGAHIRYGFEIANDATARRIEVGSECVLRFELAEGPGARSRLEADRRARVRERERERAVTLLVELARREPTFDLHSLAEQYLERGTLSPRQYVMVRWRLRKHRIRHEPTQFAISLRRAAHRGQWQDLQPFQREILWQGLTAAQRDAVARSRAFMRRAYSAK